MASSGNAELFPVFLIHQRPYQDNNALLEVFSREHGRIGLVAKRLRGKRSNRIGVLHPFSPLLMSWRGRGELKSMLDVEPNGPPLQLSGRILLSGFYINELLMRLLQRDDPHSDLYDLYCLSLQTLACLNAHQAQGVELQVCLRVFEKRLLEYIGYGLLLDCDYQSGEQVKADLEYHYHLGRGPVLHGATADGSTIKGASLLALSQEQFDDSVSLRQSRRLTRMALDSHLGGRELHSRKLLFDMQKTIDGHS